MTSPRSPLLATIATILVIVAMKLGEPVFLPLVLSIFLMIIGWPIQSRLEKRAPRWVAYVATLLVILAAATIIAVAFTWSVQRLTVRGPQLAERFHELSDQAMIWAQTRNLPVSAEMTPERLASRLHPYMQVAVARLYTTVAMLGLVLAYLALGLLEVRDFEAKVERRLRHRLGDQLLDTAAAISHKVRRHLVALSISSAVSGLITGIYAAALGLDLAVIWGIVTFLLNYIPTIGPLIAVVPPTLFAFLQFEGIDRPLAIFAGIGTIQFVMGNFVDPKIEGRVLSLSPLVVLFSVVFWGWLWGIFGAFLAVPLTMAIVVTCQQFDNTRWVAALLSDIDNDEKEMELVQSAQVRNGFDSGGRTGAI